MASLLEVKQYLAHWFQLGKKVYVRNGDLGLLPDKIFHDTHYSAEFDRYWDLIISDRSGECYLEDTCQTIDELLTPEWDLVDCARCSMPIPLRIAGIPQESCPCLKFTTLAQHRDSLATIASSGQIEISQYSGSINKVLRRWSQLKLSN
jgi:hypothetical protein